jgi:glycosyltransferase involved in cell wall biosynthesis
MASYNRADRIGRAIESVLMQRFADFELLIIDDGSTDATGDVARSFKDSRIRYFRKENEERSIARNFGIQHAIGKYVNFLDSDDVIFDNHLSAAHALIAGHDGPELVHMGFRRISGDGKVISTHTDFSDLDERMLRSNIMHGNAIFVRRDILQLIRFPHSRDAFISEDWTLFMRLIARYRPVFGKEVTSAIVEHEGRSLNSVDPDRLARCTEVIINELSGDDTFMRHFGPHVQTFFSRQYTFVSLISSLHHRDDLTAGYLRKALQQSTGILLTRRFYASLKYYMFPGLIGSQRT